MQIYIILFLNTCIFILFNTCKYAVASYQYALIKDLRKFRY